MAKTDPKDDRIAELELALEASSKAVADATEKASKSIALEADVARLGAEATELRAKNEALQAELDRIRVSTDPSERASVKGLDPTKAVELRVSSMVLNALTKQPVTAIAGSVLVEVSAFADLSKKLGSGVTLHPVAADEIAAAKKSGRAY